MPTTTPTLREVKVIPFPKTRGIEVDIIAIASCGSPAVDDWKIESVLDHFHKNPPSVTRIHILSFDYLQKPNSIRSWQAFFDLGNELLDLLILRTREEHRTIFICHSLGGCLLKQALNSACLLKETDPGFQKVLDNILGIVFLGTPHRLEHDQETLRRCTEIARFSAAKKGYLKTLPPLPEDENNANQIDTIAKKFEETSQLISILSVYDGVPTKLGRSWTLRVKSAKLVDRPLCMIDSHLEVLCQSECDHLDLCRFNMLPSASRIIKYMEELFEKIKRNISPNSRRTLNQRNDSTLAGNLLSSQIQPHTTELGGEASSGRSSSSFSHISGYSYPSLPAFSLSGSPTGSTSKVFLKGTLPAIIPPRYASNSDFFGRETELKQLDIHLLPREKPQTTKPRQFAIYGMGGVGKTELTVEWFHRNIGRFPAMFWIDAAEPAQLASNYAKIAQVLKIQSGGQAEDLVASREVAKSWFAQTSTPWLLVFNNADNTNLLDDYWPYGGAGSVLVTSRVPIAGVFKSLNMPRMQLETFPELEASEFVRRVAACDVNEAEHQASLELARELGGLPLAIVYVAAFIHCRQISLQEYVKTHEQRYHVLRKMGGDTRLQRYGSMIAATWTFEDLTPEATLLLRLMSILSPDCIPEHLFVSSGSLDGRPPVFTEKCVFEEAKDTLLCSSIAKRNRTTGELSIHRIIAQECRTCMSSEDLFTHFYIVVDMLCFEWPFNAKLEDRHSTSRWARCEILFPHLEHVHKLYGWHKDNWINQRHTINLVRLFQDAGAYLHERGLSYQGKPYLEDSLDLFKRVGATTLDDREILSDIHYTLGAIANETNDEKGCLENNSILLQMREEICAKTGKPDVRLAAAHSQIGIAYMMTGDLKVATEHFDKSVRMFKSLENFHIDLLGFPAANLGLSYWMQGKLDEAEAVFGSALEQREAAFGKRDTVSYKTGRILHGYGNVKASKAELARIRGDSVEHRLLLQESRAYHEAALAQLESTLGEYHHRVADLCHKMACHHIADGNHDLAQEALDRALGIWRNNSWYINQVARTTFLKGQHLLQMGGAHKDQGESLRDQAIALYHEVGKGEKRETPTQENFDNLVMFWSR